ncbi:MAG: hypothetical protein A2148_04040 [Chloroflexi bacterium RBG_16_68_14]|nr:MAG: hypothetical protein A2148_04040 [Chloroflexi bacterium RBG_16_68_14]
MRVAYLGGIFALAVAGYAGLSLLLADRFTSLRRAREDRAIAASPADEGLPFEDVTFSADVDGLVISGWLIPRTDSATAVIMIPSGGAHRLNASIDQLRLEGGQLRLARALWERGHTVLLYDPRGTGRSEGDRLSYGSLEARDLIGALRFLEGRSYPAQRVGVLAWSMGAATALFALPKVRYGGLVVDSGLGGFSHEEIARYAARALGLPLPIVRVATRVLTFGAFAAARLLWGMDLGAQAADVLRRHPVPTLVIHGKADSQVPVSSGEEIARAAGDALIGAHLLEGVEHVGAYAADPAWYAETVCAAFAEMLKRGD